MEKLYTIINKINNKINPEILILFLGIGVILRFVLINRGFNFDFESYQIVVSILEKGENVYAQTVRYNYGPIWFNILDFFYKLTIMFGNLQLFRYLVVLLLTCVDLGITYLLITRYSKIIGLIFFLNPISIIITGYHNQFDNLAILIGLIAIIYYEKSQKNSNTLQLLYSMVILGISLVVKHILIFLPFWLLLSNLKSKRKILIYCVPFLIFLISFLPYWFSGSEGIVNNVFGYQSKNNAPLYMLLFPEIFKSLISPKQFFILIMLLLGWFNRKKQAIDQFLIYTISIVVFSSGIANQYLAIPLIFLIINFNILSIIYLLLGGYYLLLSPEGLGLRSHLPDLSIWGNSLIHESEGAYKLLIMVLFINLIFYFWPNLIKDIIKIFKSSLQLIRYR